MGYACCLFGTASAHLRPQIHHLGGETTRGFAIFGGSNGYWRAEKLKAMTFDHGMLTEDIDSSFRSLNTGGKIVYCNQISSSELATDTLHALERQRLRWAQGWFQVTLRHFSQTWSRNELNFHQRVGYFLLLAWREAYYYFACLSIPSLLVYFLRTHFNGIKIDLAFYLLTALTTINFLLTPLEYALCWYYAHPMVREHKSWFFIAVGCSIPYNLYLWFLSLRAHIREVRRPRVSRSQDLI